MLKKWLIGFVLTTLALLAWSGSLHAQTGYVLDWFNMNSSGVVSEASDYTLHGATGQAEAGQLRTGGYTLTGGVLAAMDAAPPDPVPSAALFLPRLSH